MRKTIRPNSLNREGAVLPFVAILLPVLLLLSGIAINLAQVELARTELQIATDVATRAAGRAWTATGDINAAIDAATFTASLNHVNNNPVVLEDENIVFGNTTRPDQGRFVFNPAVPQPDPENIVANQSLITSIQVVGNTNTNLFFRIGDISSMGQRADAVTSQVDRDIALVIDRSGSMAYFEEEQLLYNAFTTIYNGGNNAFGITGQQYIDSVADFQGPTTNGEDSEAVPSDVPTVDLEDLLGSLGARRNRRNLPALALNDRFYSQNVIDGLNSLISTTSDSATVARLQDLMSYAETVSSDYNPQNGQRTGAPDQSRWSVLEQAMESFVDVLDQSNLEETVSVISFAGDNDVTVDLELTTQLDLASQVVNDLIPTGSTAIGEGMITAAENLFPNRRINAIPTLLVFSDGESRRGTNPVTAAQRIKADNPLVIINTVTFADGDQTEMQQVAEIGGGAHYHANDGDELRQIFEIIARSFSTVIVD